MISILHANIACVKFCIFLKTMFPRVSGSWFVAHRIYYFCIFCCLPWPVVLDPEYICSFAKTVSKDHVCVTIIIKKKKKKKCLNKPRLHNARLGLFWYKNILLDTKMSEFFFHWWNTWFMSLDKVTYTWMLFVSLVLKVCFRSSEINILYPF